MDTQHFHQVSLMIVNFYVGQPKIAPQSPLGRRLGCVIGCIKYPTPVTVVHTPSPTNSHQPQPFPNLTQVGLVVYTKS